VRGGSAAHSQLCELFRWQKVPAAQQLPLAAAHMASAPQAAVPPQGRPAGMRRWPVHESSAAEGWQAQCDLSRLRQAQPAGQQVPGYCPSLGAYALPAATVAAAPDSDMPPHCAQGLSSAPAGQLVGASHTVLFSLSLITRLPSTTCGARAACCFVAFGLDGPDSAPAGLLHSCVRQPASLPATSANSRQIHQSPQHSCHTL
jgi:hypothetical protein